MKRYAHRRALELLERLARQIERTGAAGGAPDADAVHDLRVTIRRLKACLRLFARHFPKKARKRLGRRLTELMDRAAAVRDRDITQALLLRAGVAPDSALAVRLHAQRVRAAGRLAEAVQGWEPPQAFAAHLDVDARAEAHANGDADRDLAPDLDAATRHARARLPKLAADYFSTGRALAADRRASPAHLHAFRLATKRLRYTLELYRPCYGPGIEKRLAQLRAIQTFLGDLNDCVAARRLLARLAPPEDLNRQHAAGFLARHAIELTTAFREHWRLLFDAPGRERLWRSYLAK